MPKREVDKRKTTKALRKLRKVVERTSAETGPKLTAWEQEFVSGVSERLETYGSAFRDLSKGRAEEALSVRQAEVARVIERKSRPKTKETPDKTPAATKAERPGGFRRSTFKPKVPAGRGPRVRDINDDPDHVLRDAGHGGSADAAPRNATPTPRHTTEPAPKTHAARQKSPSKSTSRHAPAPPAPAAGRPSLRLIQGGKGED